MKKNLFFTVATIMIAALLVTVVGCKKDDEFNGENPLIQLTINPNYVPINWNTTSLLSSNDSIGDYQIRFDGSVPDIHPGSILAIDKDTMVYYIFVKTVNVSGNTVSVTSTKAYLTDIFFDTDITLATLQQSKSKAKGAVFYPTKVFEVDKDGVIHTLYTDSPNGRKIDIDTPIVNVPLNFDGLEIYHNGSINIYMEKCNFNFGLDLVMNMNFSGRTVREVIDNAIERYRSEALNINAYMDGTFETEQVLRCDVEGSYNFAPGYEIIYHDWFEKYIAFVVGGVPVVIQLNSDLYREVQGSISGDLTAYAGFRDRLDGRIGFEWQQGQGMRRVFETENHFELVNPTVEGHGSMQGKAWFFPRFRVMLYGTLGPSFDLKPYCADTISGGFREELGGQENDYIGWNLRTHAGVDACCGLSLQFIGYEIENWSTDDWNIIDLPLFKSPYKVVHTGGSYAPLQSHLMSFTIYDTNYLLRLAQPTRLPQVVKFQANGTLSKEYDVAILNGIVSVAWTPVNNDILYALMYDPHGSIIAWDTVHAGDIHANDWVDLGLPSGTLWANRNVGAILPEDRGDFFAWGETETKNYYWWDTYLYGDNNQFTKYCTNPASGYNGYSDTLTVLQPEDDAATVHWGNGARTPTREEWYELFQNTTIHHMYQNGVRGWRVDGSNGNSIFLPSTGTYRKGTLDLDESMFNRYGFYWSSTLDTYTQYFAVRGDLYFNTYSTSGLIRCFGLPVRAVRSASKKR